MVAELFALRTSTNFKPGCPCNSGTFIHNLTRFLQRDAAMLARSWESQFYPPVCPFVTRMLCDKTKHCTADILIPRERAITVVFLTPTVVNGRRPICLKFALKVTHPFEKCRLRQISAYNVLTVRDSENSSIMTNRKSTTGFPTSYRL